MLGLIILIAMAVFFYKLAEFEDLDSPIIWAVLSIAVHITVSILGWGWLGLFGGYLLLIGGVALRMTAIRKRQMGV